MNLHGESARLFALWKEAVAAEATDTHESTEESLEQVLEDTAKRALALDTPSLAPVAFTALPERALPTRAIVMTATIIGVAILGSSYALARTLPHDTSPATAAHAASIAQEPAVASAPPLAAHEPTEIAEISAPVADAAPEATHETSADAPSLPAAVPLAASVTDEPARAPRAHHARPTDREPVAPSAVTASTGEATSPADEPVLPPAPTRADVVSAMSSVAPAVEACAGGAHGVADVRIVVAGTGRVANALVTGTFVGTPTGSCIARAMRTASFPAFAGPSFTFVYPVQF